MNSKLQSLAALAMVALVGAGCSSGSAGKGSDNTGSTSTASTASSTTASNREKAVKFAECMRDNGVSAFPDPDASGELTIDAVANGSSLDTSSSAFTKALGACKDLQPSGFVGHKRSAEEQKPALKFAQCIRENGVKDFPDPTPDAPLVDTNRIPSAASSSGMTILNAAMQKCGDVLGDLVRDQP